MSWNKERQDGTIRVQLLTADGIKTYMRVNRSFLNAREIRRTCFKILRMNTFIVDPASWTPTSQTRIYVLWNQLKNGTYVFREDL